MPGNSNRQTAQQAGRHFGKYRGTVTNNQDPKNLGRIRAKVPAVLFDEETGWAVPCVPYAGNGVGLFSLPPLEAGVWIEFEDGDVSRPIWSGCWWAEKQAPRDNRGTMAQQPLKIIRSEKGLMVTMDDAAETITVSDSDGSNLVEIKVQQGKITVKGATKVVVEAPQIELVESAAHPAVFGDELLNYLNQLVQIYQTHLHPGQTAAGFPVTPAPPVPPLPPATPVLISTRVKTG
jgi:hypothetical protein